MTRYRPEIDGLRAVAVMAVLMFHAGLPLAGSGFVGVDIFFVISGYLITGIVLRDDAAGQFSLVRFYSRRARRLLPALLAVAAASVAFGWFFLNASELTDLASSAAAALTGVSNIRFARHIGYFDADAPFAPLLMTWSLGIEEQFYLIFPMALLLVHRRLARHTGWVLLGVTAAGFAFAEWRGAVSPDLSYFALSCRAWELAAGATIAAWERGRQQPFRANALLAWGGLGLIVLAIEQPGAERLSQVTIPLAVAGAAALIASSGTILHRRVLASRPLVFVGLVSYSLYLWHWPLLSFARLAAVYDLTRWTRVLLAVAAFVLAVLSWRLIERPFRVARSPARRVLVRYGAVVAASVFVMAGIRWSGGVPQRLPARAAAAEALGAHRGDCLADAGQDLSDLPRDCTADGAVALIGDSHAAALGFGLKEVAARDGWRLRVIAKSGCPPLLDAAAVDDDDPAFAQACNRFVRDAAGLATADPAVRTVLLAGYWDDYESQPAADRTAGLARTVALLQQAGKAVVIVGDVPAWHIDPAHLALASTIPLRGVVARGVWPAGQGGFPVDRSALFYTPNAQRLAGMTGLARQTGAGWVDLHARMCRLGECLIADGGDWLYADQSHVSPAGSRYAAPAIAAALADRPR